MTSFDRQESGRLGSQPSLSFFEKFSNLELFESGVALCKLRKIDKFPSFILGSVGIYVRW